MINYSIEHHPENKFNFFLNSKILFLIETVLVPAAMAISFWNLFSPVIIPAA